MFTTPFPTTLVEGRDVGFLDGAILDLDFINNRAFVGGKQSLESCLSLTRATTGYAQRADGQWDVFASGQLRQATKGLLVEAAATNLVLQSQTIDNAAWQQSGTSTVTANTTIAPDGTTTADSLIEDTTNGLHGRYPSAAINISANTVYTYSVFIKAGARSFVYIPVYNTDFTQYFWAEWNLTTGAVANSGTSGANAVLSATAITAFANGWYLLSLSGKVDAASTSAWPTVYPESAVSVSGYVGSNGQTALILWNAQLEAGAFATSPILTTSAAVTRNADAVTLTVPTQIVMSGGALFVEWDAVPGAVAATGAIFKATVDGNNSILLTRTSGNKLSWIVTSGAAAVATLTSTNSVIANTKYRTALRWALNDFAAAFTASLETGALTDASGAVPVGTTATVNIGSDASTYSNGFIRRLAYFPAVKPNAELLSWAQGLS